MKADPFSIPILSPLSVHRRRRLTLMAFLLGLGSVALSLVIVEINHLRNLEIAEQEYLRTTKNEVAMLAAAVNDGQKMTDQKLLVTIEDKWIWAGGHWSRDKDEHFLVVNNVDSRILRDTGHRGPSEDLPASDPLNQVVIEVRNQMGSRALPILLLYSDTFKVGGEALIGSFKNTSQPNSPGDRDWLLGIYRSQAGVHAAAAARDFSLFGTLIAMCGLAMPISLLLMYYTYQVAQRDQVLAEQGRARLAAIVQDSEDAIFTETFDGVITSWNRGAERLFGYSETEALGRRSADIIPSQHSAEERQAIEQVVRGERAEDRAIETIRACKNGNLLHVLQTISPVNDERGNQIGVSIIARDITERKNLEREVLESAGREQQRIGRELHDSLGQELTGLSYLAKSLAQKLAAAENPQAETAQSIAGGIQAALREVRSAVQGLVPVEVDASGFIVALEKLAAQTTAHCGIDCRIECPEPIQVDDNVLATHLFRIVQEAINNAVKHAHAQQIAVRPQLRNGALSVTVEDDGVGIAEHVRHNGGMGLRIMQYRAGVIDAALDVHATERGGTAVVCLVKNQADKVKW
jgi:PAS domain S-box-containing protein